MNCHNGDGQCKRKPKCNHACDMRVAFDHGKAAGWADCVSVWARHMAGMNKAMRSGQMGAETAPVVNATAAPKTSEPDQTKEEA